jgi:hypothetical protein
MESLPTRILRLCEIRAGAKGFERAACLRIEAQAGHPLTDAEWQEARRFLRALHAWSFRGNCSMTFQLSPLGYRRAMIRMK